MMFMSLGLLGLLASPAVAQESDEEAKKKILERVERRLKQEDERLLKEIEKLVDDALKGKAAPAAPKAAAKKGRGYIGIRADEVPADQQKALGIKGGLKITEVVAGGPAAAAGLKADDVIVSLDGRAIDAPIVVPEIIQAAGVGATIKVDYFRAGKKRSTKVTLGRHPADVPEKKPTAKADPKDKKDLRERVKKFMDKAQEEKPKQEPRKPQAKKPKEEAPKDGPFALDENFLDQLEGMFEQFGVDRDQLQELLDQFMEKDDDGNFKLPDSFKDLLKGFDMEKLLPGGAAPEEENPAPKPRREFKRTGKAWLGVQPEEVSEALAAQLDLEKGVGLLVVEVLPGSPAAKAGIKKNDILLQMGKTKLRGEQALAEFMNGAKVGQEAQVTVLRKGAKKTLKVKFGERME